MNLQLDCPPLEAAIVRFILNFDASHIPATVRAAASRVLRDQFGSLIGNSNLPWSRQILAYTAARHACGKSRVITSERTMSPADAAFTNAALTHGFEYDEGHRASGSHPGVGVVPAALAVGEDIGATLEQVVTAIITGYEVYTRIGLLVAPDLIKRGFHPAAVLAPFGAATVTAKLRGYDAQATLHALAIALSHASGVTEYTSSGGSAKRIHPAIGVRGGIFSAELAQAGVTGPTSFLSGVKGFCRTFVQRGPAPDAAETFALDAPFQILRGGFKRYCCCGCNHAAIDILTDFAGQRDAIESVLLRIPRVSNTMVGTANADAYRPREIEQVQFSLPLQAAFALLGWGNGYPVHRAYVDGTLDMERAHKVAERVHIEEAPEFDERYPGKFVAEATIRFSNGQKQTRFVEDSLGTSDNPMDEAAHDTKFMELTADLLGQNRATGLLAVLRQLDGNMPVRDLTAMAVIHDRP